MAMFDARGTDLPMNMPIHSFNASELPELPDVLRENLARAGYVSPTVLQRSAVPVGLAGRDMAIIAAERSTGQAASLLLPLITPVINTHGQIDARKSSISQPQALLLAPARPPLATLAR
eukprot:CAMPEP_0119342802 /NCGR_PEP_ID=MMETSP1333-20130426/105455_1 /TAXON_ID=418940 /ORGANISM="Scyphosphaera apsteinii, Strain RCC1455" /LENGTH=118 /DNA_ID=CAMNT_0007355091 /DNA_START=10 /DNA_END=363 /DNA_ORIENTATION=-